MKKKKISFVGKNPGKRKKKKLSKAQYKKQKKPGEFQNGEEMIEENDKLSDALLKGMEME